MTSAPLRQHINIGATAMGGSYTTIPVRKEVKKILEQDKGEEEWSDYLLQLYRDAKLRRKREAFEKLRNLVGEKELSQIEEEYRVFRERFTLG